MKQYTLSELSAAISMALEMTLPDAYWVRAEISSLQVKNGHCYLDLVEKNPQGLLAARQRAVCWANRYTMLSAYFRESTGSNLQAGMKVLVQVSINFHAAYGLSLIIEQIDPSYTLGEVAKDRELTIKKLEQEGVIDLNKSLPLPSLIRHIAIISTDTAAGYGDFMYQLKNNAYGFQFHADLYPSIMQGERAVESILDALSGILQSGKTYDIVLICRGGGATTDLGCFDQYAMAAACANYPLPLIAGIGHQRDVSVVDIVAHTSVKTPTAAAEFIISHNAQQWDRVRQLTDRLQFTATRYTQTMQKQLSNLLTRMQLASSSRVQKERQRLAMMEHTITLRNPLKIYEMGYSLTTCNGRIIRSVHEVQAGETISTELPDGTIKSIVMNN